MNEPPALYEAEVDTDNRLHLFYDSSWPGHEWSIWLDTDISERDGICIAVSNTKSGALRDAESVLRCAADRVKQLL